MKSRFPLVALLLSLIFAFNSLAQQRMSGKVVEIIDGRTVSLELPTRNRIVAQLEFVEIPEPEQTLSRTVKTHLQNLLLGKSVDFVANSMGKARLIGKIYLDGVDMSRQLLRDGAAWYALPEKERQSAGEREEYQALEAQAKAEKRGVWSEENLSPAWEFRAEKEKAKRDETAKANEAIPVLGSEPTYRQRPTRTTQRKTVSSATMWADVSGTEEKKYLGIEGLYSGSFPDKNISYIYTGGTFPAIKQKEIIPKMEFRALYAYRGNQTAIEKDGYVIGFLSDSKKYQFLKANSLTIYANGSALSFGKAFRLFRPTPYGVQELLLYKINRAALEKISKAKSATFKIGNFNGELYQDARDLMGKLTTVGN